MSRLEELIQELCPNGVEYMKLGELGKFFGGLTGKSKDDFTDGNAKFITYKNVYANPSLQIDVEERVKIADGERQRTLQYGDVIFTGSSETPDECGMSSVVTVKTEEKLYLNSFCFFFRFDDLNIMLPGFAKHLFRSNELRYQIGKTANGVTRYNISKKMMEKVSIPVPPLEVQREIVRILDSFTLLTAELTAELTARKKQYQHYLNSFFENQKDNLVPLSSLGTITRGKRFVHADATETGVPCIHYGELYTFYGVHANTVKSHIREELRPKMRYAHKGDVIIVGAGENNIDIGVGVAWEGNEDVAVHDACYTLCHSQNSKYISFYLRSDMYHNQIKKYVSEGKVCSISATGLGKALIPLPSITEQKRIVSILDRFDSLCNDITTGLPAEIEARQKQYEFYRDKLLSFEQL